MLCFQCKKQISDAYIKCPHCGADLTDKVRVMSKAEQMNYDGITIENDDHATDGAQQHQQWGYNSGSARIGNIYIKKMNWGSWGSNWLTKIAITMLIAAIAGFLLFVFLPIALIAVAVGIVIWFILSFLKK